MGVFEDVVVNARSAAATVGKQAGRLVDISMLRLDAAEIQREISKKYEALGRIVYDSCKSGSSPNTGFEGQIEIIDALYRKLDEVNEKISVLRKKTVCPNCGFNNEENAAYCSRCGAKLSEQSTAAQAPSDAGEQQSGQTYSDFSDVK